MVCGNISGATERAERARRKKNKIRTRCEEWNGMEWKGWYGWVQAREKGDTWE